MGSIFISNSISETKNFATMVAMVLKKGDVLLLNGPLGSGKTTISKYIISSLTGLYEGDITSPTFSILKYYKINVDTSVIHVDLYNVPSIDSMYMTDLLSSFEENITIIEWPQIIEKKLVYAYKIHIFLNDGDRKFAVNKNLYEALNERELL